jgi:hypothetical protein
MHMHVSVQSASWSVRMHASLSTSIYLPPADSNMEGCIASNVGNVQDFLILPPPPQSICFVCMFRGQVEGSEFRAQPDQCAARVAKTAKHADKDTGSQAGKRQHVSAAGRTNEESCHVNVSGALPLFIVCRRLP